MTLYGCNPCHHDAMYLTASPPCNSRYIHQLYSVKRLDSEQVVADDCPVVQHSNNGFVDIRQNKVSFMGEIEMEIQHPTHYSTLHVPLRRSSQYLSLMKSLSPCSSAIGSGAWMEHWWGWRRSSLTRSRTDTLHPVSSHGFERPRLVSVLIDWYYTFRTENWCFLLFQQDHSTK